MDLSIDIYLVISSFFGAFANLWNLIDQIYIFPSVSLLTLFVASYTLSLVLWVVFGFYEKE